MGKITFSYVDPSPTGYKPSVGSIVASLIRREKVGNAWVTIKAFNTKLVNGKAEIDLSDTTPNQLWRISEVGIEGAKAFHVQVSGDDMFYRMLDVDPETLEPSPEALAGWTATLAAITLKAAEAKASADLAKQYAVDRKGDPGEKGDSGLSIVGGDGDKGDKGDPGMRWRGVWNTGVDYLVGDLVATGTNGGVFVSKLNARDRNPVTDLAAWDTFSQRGLPGVTPNAWSTFTAIGGTPAAGSTPWMTMTAAFTPWTLTSADPAWNGTGWLVPANGTYLVTMSMRILDSNLGNVAYGFGVNQTVGDGSHFKWAVAGPAGTRRVDQYTRVIYATAGQRLISFYYGSADLTVSGVTLSITKTF